MKPPMSPVLLVATMALAGLALAAPQPQSIMAGLLGEEAIDPGEWDQGNLSLAADGNGNLYAAWNDCRAGTLHHVRFAYRPHDGSWTASVAVDSTGDREQLSPSLAVDAAGNAYLAWEDDPLGSEQIHVRFAYRPAGGAWGESEMISGTAVAQVRPALAVNSPGVAVVVWAQGGATSAEIYAALRPAGGPWGAAEQVTPATGVSRRNPHAALDNAGRAYAIWNQSDTGGRNVYYASRPAGGAWSAIEQVNDGVTNSTWLVPRLAAPAEGGGPVHAIWMDERAGNSDIYHATRPLNGQWSANTRVNDDAGSADQWTPSPALDGSGTATAVWVDRRNGGWDLYQAVRPAGGSWGANTLLVASPLPGWAKNPASGTGAIDTPTTVAGGRVTGYSKATTSDPILPHNVFVYMTAGQVARIDVTPSAANLSVGQQQQFTATGYDAYQNPVPIDPAWSATGGTITQGGLYTAGTQAGDFVVTASVEGSSVMGTASVHVTAGALARIEVTPSAANLSVGQQQQFTATGYDPYDNPAPIDPVWSATGGEITPSGLYTATVVGDFVVSATVVVRSDTIIGRATVHVTPAGVEQLPGDADRFTLSQNHPNPCRGTSMIEFGVPAPCHVELTLWDIHGRRVATLVDQSCGPGTYRVVFDAGCWSSGLYLYRIRWKEFEAVRRMVVLAGDRGR